MCQVIQESVTNESKRYLEEMGRYNYVTPTSYLELLGIYSMLADRKKKELMLASSRLKTGLDKVLFNLRYALLIYWDTIFRYALWIYWEYYFKICPKDLLSILF